MQTNDFEVVQPIDEQMDGDERKRLLYVATTRAKDHLVVSLHRAGNSTTSARVLADAGAVGAAGAVAFESDSRTRAVEVDTVAVTPPPDWDSWHASLLEAQSAARRRSSISASGLEGTDPETHFGSVRSATSSASPVGFADSDSAADPPALFEITSVAQEEFPAEDVVVDPPGSAKGPTLRYPGGPTTTARRSRPTSAVCARRAWHKPAGCCCSYALCRPQGRTRLSDDRGPGFS